MFQNNNFVNNFSTLIDSKFSTIKNNLVNQIPLKTNVLLKGLDLKTALILVQQFTPFILIWYFIIYSIINSTMAGIVVILGMIFSICVSMIFGYWLPQHNPNINMLNCNYISINYISAISNIPFSQSIYGFTFAYLLYTDLLYKQAFQYFLPLLCFLIFIISDIIWLSINSCYPKYNIIITTGLSMFIGLLWGYNIAQISNKSLQYVSSQNKLCEIPYKREFKCRTRSVSNNTTLPTSTNITTAAS